ncbi:MAG: homoserine kinase [Pseudomonadota bacterium]
MSVYTSLDAGEIQSLLDIYQQGSLLTFRGIAEGIENTNYFVSAKSQSGVESEFVLTLFETTASENLDAYFDLMAHLAATGLPVAEPAKTNDRQYLTSVKNKPAALIARVPGTSVPKPSLEHCCEVGRFLGRLHQCKQKLDTLENFRGAPWRERTIRKLQDAGTDIDQQLLSHCHQEASQFEQANLPRGIIHGDLFHDNALFVQNKLTGVIDFYYAHSAPFIYDIAVCVADWCVVVNNGHVNAENARAIVKSYEEIRAISPSERHAWFRALAVAALRFYLSRLHDQHFPRQGAITQEKDPGVFLELLKKCQLKSNDVDIFG